MVDVTRRGLLGMLAAGVGAAIVRPGLLMPIKPPIVTRVPTATEISLLEYSNVDAWLDHMADAWRYAMDDARKFGTGLVRTNADGSIVHIDPFDMRAA